MWYCGLGLLSLKGDSKVDPYPYSNFDCHVVAVQW